MNHRERVERLIEKALDDKRKELGSLEKPGFFVNGPSIWPVRAQDGSPTGQVAPAWFVGVSLKSTGIGEPEIFNGLPVYDILPRDEHFITVAQGLYEMALQQKSQTDASATLAAAAAGWSKDKAA